MRIAGVIFNRVGGERHAQKLRRAVEHYTDIPVLGSVPQSADMEIVERHLGLMPSNEHAEAATIIRRIARVIANSVDVEAVLEASRTGSPLPEIVSNGGVPAPDTEEGGSGLRIGIPRDAAFGFYYPGDLEALRSDGVELVFFDALGDTDLPVVDGLFLGGGFPESRMEALASNVPMRRAIHDFVDQGKPVYAECGGLMYLCRSLTWGDRSCPMAGVIPADAVMYDRPQGRGYVRLRDTDSNPWPASLTPESRTITAHEFHYSRLENIDRPLTFAYRVERGHGIDGEHDGIVHKNLLASYAHLRDVAGYHWTKRFLAHVNACRQ